MKEIGRTKSGIKAKRSIMRYEKEQKCKEKREPINLCRKEIKVQYII